MENEKKEEKFEIALSNDRLIEVAQRAEQRIEAVVKMKRIALKVTNKNDWIDESGKPYLTVSGSEKVARVFGVSWTIDEPVYEEDESGHYTYTYTGIFSFEGVGIQAIGTRSSKDPFFSKSYGKDVLPANINKPNVKKAAYTNLLGNGITRLLGIRNLTYGDLEIVGITKEDITAVQYKKPPKKDAVKKEPIREPKSASQKPQDAPGSTQKADSRLSYVLNAKKENEASTKGLLKVHEVLAPTEEKLKVNLNAMPDETWAALLKDIGIMLAQGEK